MSCKPGEVGILLGNVNAKKAINEFTGYADKKATQKKLIENVFKKGDLYFNSGDVLVQDELGYFYFKDRTGDTFRLVLVKKCKISNQKFLGGRAKTSPLLKLRLLLVTWLT